MAVWAKIHTSLRDHPKAYEAGPQAMWLYVSMILYAKERDTKGFFPASQLSNKLHGRDAQRWAKCLVRVGLVHEVDGGWQIDKYDEKQGEGASLSEFRAKKAAQKRKERAARNASVASDMSPPVAALDKRRAEKRREEGTHTELATSLEPSSFTDLTPQASETQSTDRDSSGQLVRVSASEPEFADEVERLWFEWPSNRRSISPQQLADLIIAQGVTTLDGVREVKLAATEDASSLDWREGVIPRIDTWVKQRQWDRPAVKAPTDVRPEFAHLDEGISR